MQQGNIQKSAIESFAKLAATGNADALVQTFAPAARQAIGDFTLREFLLEEIIPFFEDFQAIDDYQTVNPAGFPDGRTGLIHYTYLVTKSNTRKPFTIALINEDSSVLVGNITVNKYAKAQHPASR